MRDSDTEAAEEARLNVELFLRNPFDKPLRIRYIMELLDSEAAHQKMVENLELTGPYRGVMKTIPDKPAAPDCKLAKKMRQLARQKRWAKRKDKWETFWMLWRHKREEARKKRKARREQKSARLRELEEEAIPHILSRISGQAAEGYSKLRLDSGRLNGYDSPDLDKYDLLYIKDILSRYGFYSRRKKEKSRYHGKNYELYIKW